MFNILYTDVNLDMYTTVSCACVEDQWNRLSLRERAEKEAFIAGEKSVTRGFMKMVC